MGGGNLSLQVHPTTGYAHDRFGMAYAQDLCARHGGEVTDMAFHHGFDIRFDVPVTARPNESKAFGAWCVRDYGFDYVGVRAWRACVLPALRQGRQALLGAQPAL